MPDDGVIEEEFPRLRAPFTPEQVEALNEYQQGGWMHPFTCGGTCRERLGIEAELVATEAGWVCETCDYTQDWAHPMMIEGPPEWFRAFVTKVPDA